jgi:uncharacterized protein YecT (DUF1311 family)
MTRHIGKITGLAAMLLLGAMQASAQIEQALETSENKYQQCQESGRNVPACAARYYRETDSLLNLTYKKLRGTLKSDGKIALQKEQNDWSARRDAYFIKLKADYKGSGSAPANEDEADPKAAISEDKARFVRERIDELLGRIPEKEEEE